MSTGGISPPPRRRPPPRRADAASEASEQDDSAAEKVGYGHPPKQYRWPKGVSGNPKGKTAGTRSLRVLIDRELDVKLEVTERGRKRTRTKRQIAATRIVNKAVEGNDKALTLLLRHEGAASPDTIASNAVAAAPLVAGEQSILDHFMAAARQAVERERAEE
jgi:hypothetical protein